MRHIAITTTDLSAICAAVSRLRPVGMVGFVHSGAP